MFNAANVFCAQKSINLRAQSKYSLLQKYPSYFYGPCNFEEFNLNSAAKNKTQGLLPCFLKQLRIQTSRTFWKSSKYFSFLAR